MGTNRSVAEKLIEHIFEQVKNLSDSEYCDALEEIASACDDAASVKRSEMNE